MTPDDAPYAGLYRIERDNPDMPEAELAPLLRAAAIDATREREADGDGLGDFDGPAGWRDPC